MPHIAKDVCTFYEENCDKCPYFQSDACYFSLSPICWDIKWIHQQYESVRLYAPEAEQFKLFLVDGENDE